MPKVIISESLFKNIEKKFNNSEAKDVVRQIMSLEINPHKGKALSHASGFVIKELKYQKFRFYFITNGQILKFGTEDEIADLLIRFVRMSHKKDQQKIIYEIRNVLKSMGVSDF